MMKGGLGNLMRQAQQMQETMKKAQQELAQLEVTGEAGAGRVRITMNCNHEVRRVHFDAQLMGQDKDLLEDLVLAAVNDAVARIAATSREKYSGLMSGLNLPSGMKLPF